MKKKLLLGMFVAAGMLFTTSCSKEEIQPDNSLNEATVSFTLGVESGVQTRAISDGSCADKLVYAVYNANGNEPAIIKTIKGADDNGQFVKTGAFADGLKETVKLTLAKGQEYTVAFWAQDADCNAYNTVDLKAVGVTYNGINNDEIRDAFFGVETFTVTGNAEIDVTLKRPFAQLNVGVTKADWDAAKESGVEVIESSVVVKNAGTTLDLFTGKVTGETEVKYASSVIPSDPEFLKVDVNNDGKVAEDGSETFNWLSMSYILVADGSEDGRKSAVVDADFTFYSKAGKPIVLDEGLNTVPVQRNWRTNILGKLLTGDVILNVVIDPIYDNSHNNLNGNPSTNEIAEGVAYDPNTKTFSVYSADGLMWIAAQSNLATDANNEYIVENLYGEKGVFGGQTIELTQDINLEGETWIPISNSWGNAFRGSFNGNGYTISNLSTTGNTTAGLFGNVINGGKIENVVISDAEVTGTGYTGAVVGQMYSSTISKCVVKDSKITDNGAWGRAGVIAGFISDGTIEGCSVTNTDVLAQRNVGGLTGISTNENKTSVLKNNTLLNVNVIADFTVTNPAPDKEFAGELIGQEDKLATKENNKIDNVTVSILRGQSGVYEVNNADDLFAVAAMINAGQDFGSKTIRLIEDIDLGGKNWTPINLYNAEGTLLSEIDGNGKSIKNMTIKGGSDNGFISMTAGTGKLTIKNLTFENPMIETTGSRVGTVIGHQYGQVELNGVKVTNGNFMSTDEKGIKLGGLIGQSEYGVAGSGNATLTLINCVVEGCVFTGYHTLAGLVAYIAVEDMSSNITDCHSNGNTFYYKDSRSLGTNNPWSNYYNRGGHNDGIVASSCTTTGNEGVNYIADGVFLMSDGIYRISNAVGIEYVVNNADKTEIKINITEDIKGNIEIWQRRGISVLIDGLQHKFDGSIVIKNVDQNSSEVGTMTIKNINFESGTFSGDFISSNTGSNYVYKLDIQNCSFKNTGNGANVVAFRSRQDVNITIKDCIAEGLHSFVQSTSSRGLTIENVTAKCSEGGVNLLTSTEDTKITNCKFEVGQDYGYGIRADANGNASKVTVNGCEFKAFAPVLLRKATGKFELTLSGTNTFNSSNTDGYQIVVTGGTNWNASTALAQPTGTINITGADNMKIYR